MLRKRPSPREVARDQLCALYDQIGYESPVEHRLGLGLLAALLDLGDRLDRLSAPLDPLDPLDEDIPTGAVRHPGGGSRVSPVPPAHPFVGNRPPTSPPSSASPKSVSATHAE